MSFVEDTHMRASRARHARVQLPVRGLRAINNFARDDGSQFRVAWDFELVFADEIPQLRAARALR